MKLLPFAKGLHSSPVRSFADIKPDVERMRKLINEGGFQGMWDNGFAVHHSQVSTTPFDFFVLREDIASEFPSDVICNARITDKADRVPFKEACLSFLHRGAIKGQRYWKVTVLAEVPKLTFMMQRLRAVSFEVSYISAFIVQHECDHAKGVDIYSKFGKG